MESLENIKYNNDARELLQDGADYLAEAVKTTLGPKGRNVVFQERGMPPHVTKDGVTVARNVQIKDPIMNMGADMVRETASKTLEAAGDGTTTAIVLAQALIHAGEAMIMKGANPIDVVRGIEETAEKIKVEIRSQAKVVEKDSEDIRNIATVSANNDPEIGQYIYDAISKIGRDGIVTLDESITPETHIDVTTGMKLERGYRTARFVTDPRTMICEMTNPLVLLAYKKLTHMDELLPAMEIAAKNGRPLLVIAKDIEDSALEVLARNKMDGKLLSCAVQAPSYGLNQKAIMEDLAILTGALVLDPDRGYDVKGVTEDQLGNADGAVIGKTTTSIIGGYGDDEFIERRANQIRTELQKKDGENEKMLAERLGRLTGGVAVIYVGGATELELKERNDRIDDALQATRAALDDGIVAGGGIALLRARESLKAKFQAVDSPGYNAVMQVLDAPLKQILKNAGLEDSDVIPKLLGENVTFGLNVATGTYGDMIEMGIIDPAKVTISALSNAVSIANMFIMTEVAMLVE
jgi:chaperonin GroEL